MNPVLGLTLGRLCIGVTALVSPRMACRVFGLDVQASPQLGYLARIVGSRDAALGLLTLAARGEARRQLVAIGVGVDASDALAGVLAGLSGTVSKTTAVWLALPALGAVAAGLAGIDAP
ncbi:MAG: hypothetical protein M3Z50_03790 [Actinomycetota bacterium]|nr:hypothetical protein [Actinomycetota bacterium]